MIEDYMKYLNRLTPVVYYIFQFFLIDMQSQYFDFHNIYHRKIEFRSSI